jgi:signal transduction histidine kinase
MTAAGSYAYVAVPVIAAPGTAGADPAAVGVYAVVIDRGAQRAEVGRSYLLGYLPVGLGAVALIAAAGWLAAGRILRPLRKVVATTKEITFGAAGQPDIGRRLEVAGPAETAELAIAMNRMLDTLQSAFGSHRQLLDDVGHELRTPLTVVQGHLELMDHHDPAEVEATRALMLDELTRMRRLTDSLVTLAADDGPGFAKLAPLDLAPWFDELVDKARGLGDRRWLVECRDEAWVLADPQRLTEAMLELATNAVKYSADGSVVAFGLSLSASGSQREDTGAGLLATNAVADAVASAVAEGVAGGVVGAVASGVAGVVAGGVTSRVVGGVAGDASGGGSGGVSGAAPRVGQVRLWVRDEGPGIDPVLQSRIFERFTRANAGRVGVRAAAGGQVRPGAGLGLAIVAKIAAAHGGQVQLESVPGIGSRFTLVLPSLPDGAGPSDGGGM